AALFGFLLPLQLLNLLTLLFQLLLLLLDLRLGLLVGVLIVLHRITDCEAARSSHGRADSSACERCADGGADDRASGRADARTAQGALFTRGKRGPGASGNQAKRGEGQRTCGDGVFAHSRSSPAIRFHSDSSIVESAVAGSGSAFAAIESATESERWRFPDSASRCRPRTRQARRCRRRLRHPPTGYRQRRL